MAMLNIYLCWISMEFGFIRFCVKLYIMKKKESVILSTSHVWWLREVSKGSRAVALAPRPQEQPLKPPPSSWAPACSDHCGAEPIFKCLHLVPPTFMVALGVVRIRTQWKLLGHLTLYFLCSKCLNSAPVFPTVQNFTFENRGKRKHAERGRSLQCCLIKGEKRHHTFPQYYWAPCQSTPLFRQSLTWTSPPQYDDGGKYCQEETNFEYPYIFRKYFLVLF